MVVMLRVSMRTYFLLLCGCTFLVYIEEVDGVILILDEL